MLLKVGGGRAVTCSTDWVAPGRGDTAERAVHRATWSTGTILMVLFMSGTRPSWTHPLTKRQRKSSVLVTELQDVSYKSESDNKNTYPQS